MSDLDKKKDAIMWSHFNQRRILVGMGGTVEQFELLYKIQFEEVNMKKKEYVEYFKVLMEKDKKKRTKIS